MPLDVPSEGDVVIEEVTAVSDELIDAWRRLLPQLSRSAGPVERWQLEAIVDSPATVMFVARLDETIVGSITLILFRVPTGLRAWIEDVVVDEAGRGRGIGARLTRSAIERASTEGARTVDLTSRPSREAANKLYQRVGFARRDTNVYRYTEEAKEPRG